MRLGMKKTIYHSGLPAARLPEAWQAGA